MGGENPAVERLVEAEGEEDAERIREMIRRRIQNLPRGLQEQEPEAEEVEVAIRESIEFHLEGLRSDHLPVPPPSSRVEYVEVAA